MRVNPVVRHYDDHLAPIYVWMVGGIEQALTQGQSDLAAFLTRPGIAVDLGAGFGMHSIPLARAGFDVLAVDSSHRLLTELRRHSAGLTLAAIEADLMSFTAHLHQPADLILCMGDTLTHLQRASQVTRLMRDVAESLRPGGQFVATFRDYRVLPLGERRFISVRGDSERVHTCFLEAKRTRVQVHDIIHERVQDGWSMRVSSYQKLRLSPDTVVQAAMGAGMSCRIDPGPRGMVKIIAEA